MYGWLKLSDGGLKKIRDSIKNKILIIKYLKREALRGILKMFVLCGPKKSNKTNVLFLWEINFNSKLFSFNFKSQRDQA